MVSKLYLQFSEHQFLELDDQPFGNIYEATSSAVLTEFMSAQNIVDTSEGDLLKFFVEKNKNWIADLSRTSGILKKLGIPTALIRKQGSSFFRKLAHFIS